MLNRRLIRIKVFKVLFARISSGSMSVSSAQEDLLRSCIVTKNLFYYILGSSLAVRNFAEERIEAGLKKFYPTPEESNPNRKFVEMEFFRKLSEDEEFSKYCSKNGLLWGEDQRPVVRSIYNSMVSQDYYKNFMNSPDKSLRSEAEFLKDFFSAEYEDNEGIEYLLEDQDIMWIDDLGYVLIHILKSLSAYANSGKIKLPGVFSDEKARKGDEDAEFSESDREYALKLLSESMLQYQDNLKLISAASENWDQDRLFFSDILLICMGLTEAKSFPSIPVKVTINEYVEISKFYSTKNSRIFVNGLLDKLVKQLMSEGKVAKSGRGLIE